MLSCIQLFATPWTVAHQAPLSMGFFRPEYWSGLPFPSPGDLHDPGIKLGSPTLQADSLPSESQGRPIAQGRGFHPQEEGSFGSRMWGLLWGYMFVAQSLCLGRGGQKSCPNLVVNLDTATNELWDLSWSQLPHCKKWLTIPSLHITHIHPLLYISPTHIIHTHHTHTDTIHTHTTQHSHMPHIIHTYTPHTYTHHTIYIHHTYTTHIHTHYTIHTPRTHTTHIHTHYTIHTPCTHTTNLYTNHTHTHTYTTRPYKPHTPHTDTHTYTHQTHTPHTYITYMPSHTHQIHTSHTYTQYAPHAWGHEIICRICSLQKEPDKCSFILFTF